MKKKKPPISENLIRTICARLRENKRVRRTLCGGRIHIDRQLPFIAVYREPLGRPDAGTRRLVMGEASYLTASGNPLDHEALRRLVKAVAETLSGLFGAFLIVELWSNERGRTGETKRGLPPKPAFKILTDLPPSDTLRSSLFGLEDGLRRIRIHKVPARTEIRYESRTEPPDMSPLLRSEDARRLSCFTIGLEVQPVHQMKGGEKTYPLVLQKLHHGIGHALKMSFFEFARAKTTHRPKNYQQLGRRAMVKAVDVVDRRLARISASFDFLHLATPINMESAWLKFKNNRFKEKPVFYYRPLPQDPVALKKDLLDLPLHHIEDPTLASLFREKQIELDQKLTLLMYRERKQFLYGGLQLYGQPDDALIRLAERLMRKTARKRGENGGPLLSASAFARKAQKELEFFRKKWPDLPAGVRVEDDYYGNFVLRGVLLVGRNTRIPAARAEALIQHEVGTHLLTYLNGLTQPFRQLSSGLAGYEEMQEGLAVLAEYFVGGLNALRMRTLAARVLTVRALVEGATFLEAFRKLAGLYRFSERMAFHIAMRVYRSGGLAKDMIYLRGLVQAVKYFKNGGDLEPLLAGKIAVSHVPIIEELRDRKVLRPILLKPRYLESPKMAQRLKRLRQSLEIEELIESV